MDVSKNEQQVNKKQRLLRTLTTVIARNSDWIQLLIVVAVCAVLLILNSSSRMHEKQQPSRSEETSSVRNPARLNFPVIREQQDQDDILEKYTDYLQFVADAANSAQPDLASKLLSNFEKLRNSDPKLAAKFLKQLRYELLSKLQMDGYDPQGVSTHHPKIQPWIKRNIRTWNMEAEEMLFQSVAKRPVDRQ